MIYLVSAFSVFLGLLSLFLYVKYNQFSLAIALPAFVSVALVTIVVNVAFLDAPAFSNFRIPLIIGGIVFLVTLILTGLVTPVLSWAVFASILYAPFFYTGLDSGVMAIVALVGGVVLTWLFFPVLKTLVIGFLSAYNMGFGVSLLFLPNAEMTLNAGLITTIVAFVGTIFLARERWSKGFRQIKSRFNKNTAPDTATE